MHNASALAIVSLRLLQKSHFPDPNFLPEDLPSSVFLALFDRLQSPALFRRCWRVICGHTRYLVAIGADRESCFRHTYGPQHENIRKLVDLNVASHPQYLEVES